VSTDQIGLARVSEGLELVRIGDPQRPEMAAWRYGDQFGRRRRKQYLIGGGIAVLAGTVLVAGPMLGIIGAGAVSPLMNLISTGGQLYRARTLISVPTPGGELVRTRLSDIDRVKLDVSEDDLVLTVPVVTGPDGKWWRYRKEKTMRTFTGDDAVRAAGALLPRLNQSGGNVAQVQRAVGIIEEAQSPQQLFNRAARDLATRDSRYGNPKRKTTLKKVPLATRLALEMATHEESERRALEGELHVLAEAWRQADEIAAIADDMFLPASVEDDLQRLKRASSES
jgi:hypothetical protein